MCLLLTSGKGCFFFFFFFFSLPLSPTFTCLGATIYHMCCVCVCVGVCMKKEGEEGGRRKKEMQIPTLLTAVFQEIRTVQA